MSVLIWFAVVVELVPVTVPHAKGDFGQNPTTGALMRVDLERDGKCYAVCGKYGSALRQLADENAEASGGRVVTVESKYMFNTTDIDLNAIVKMAA